MNDDARKKIFEEFKEMIRTETVVGQPIYLDDATIVPFVDISFGFGTGNHGTNGESSGEAGGGKMSPTAVLIMKGERVELFSIKNATPNGTIDRVLNMIPEAVSHFTKKKEKKRRKSQRLKKKCKTGELTFSHFILTDKTDYTIINTYPKSHYMSGYF